MSAHAANTAADIARLDKAAGSKLNTVAYAVLGLGVLLAGAGFAADKHRFAFSYLVGFIYVLTLGLGGLFFVIIQHLTRAGWSVAARRQMEWLAGILPVAAVLFLPVVLFSHDLYHHWMGEEAKQDAILVHKSGYLNTTFFYIRAVLYFAIWTALSLYFRNNSTKQDETGDKELTLKMQGMSAPAVALFGLSLSFAAFDWIMSLDPHWFSTIFGVYIFAGSMLAALSALALMTVQLQGRGFFNKVSTTEHQHDIGKFMFGFVAFWTYIAFSQYFLIWYANLPEETMWFVHRQSHGWQEVSVFLALGHFVVPFCWLMSRTAKRSKVALSIGAVWILFMHYVDLYWLIMPNILTDGFKPHWMDLGGLLFPVGVLAVWLAMRAQKDNLYPIKDPRLAETYLVDNP
jgi:hypothetical protein